MSKMYVRQKDGKLPGKFSIAEGRQIQFSQGNLQYQASTDTWRFAEHQWDVVGSGKGGDGSSEANKVTGTIDGSNNSRIGRAYYQGWIDLFGWGTGNNPTQKSTNDADYSTFTDWGTNAISNGGNQPNQWRTLTYDEWKYLLNGRTDADKKYGVAKVNGVTGLIFLPDDWTQPANVKAFTPGVDDYYEWEGYQNKNTYTAEEWQLMENAGAVFMLATGTRVNNVGIYGNYWSSTVVVRAGYPGYLYFYSGVVDLYYTRCCNGKSVRLVSDVQATE